MTWDEIATILQITGGIALSISFIVGIAIIWTGIKANNEKNAQIQEQNERIANLTEETARANEQAAALNLKFAEAEAKRLKAEQDLLELQQRFSPRQIPQAQRETLKHVLETIPNLANQRMEIMFANNDAEAFNFAKQIRNIVLDANIPISNFTGMMRLGDGVFTGLMIDVSDGNNVLAINLQRGLQLIGHPAPGNLRPDQEPNLVVLHIGMKPPPEFA